MNRDAYTILLIDDDEDDCMLVRDLLMRAGHAVFRMDCVSSYEEGLDAVCRNIYDAILLDYRLGARNGLELIREAFGKGCEATIIFLTGQSDHGVDIEAMRAGAADYLVKDSLTEDLLERSIRYSIERKRAEKALVNAGKLFRLMADSLPMLISYLDTKQTYRFVNRAHESKYGAPAEQLVGRKIVDVLGKAFYELIRPHVEAVLQGKQVEFEMETGPQDNRVYYQIWLVPNFDDSGSLAGFFAMIHDQTQRKRSELDAQRHREELAHVSRVVSMGQLATSLAHELGQPLAGILTNAQAAQRFLTREEPDLEEVGEALGDIADDVSRARNVIDKLRSILKKKNSESTPLDMNALVHETLKLISSDALKRKIAVETDLAPNLPTVMGDRVQLQQVLINFVLNAFDAVSGCVGPRRRITILTTLDQGVVRLGVRDRGCGVDMENLDRMFEPFFSTKSEGMGMGLAISRNIINAHGGLLWAERNSGGGMTFSFSIPV
ncbi:MAG: PAS domain-containing protein [Desulfobacteraceae bacterium]|nr:PAS domain-containing protein [Desulfobacteraceae bacterium]